MTTPAPPWLATMRQITGTHALNDNPVILGWARKIGELFPDTASYAATYTHDTIAWCGLTVAYCMAVNGIRPVFGASATDRFLWALAWREFGTAVNTPQTGDVLVFDFGNNDHHVTLHEQTQGESYVCRGGNQSHEVKTSSYPASLCIAIRRPPAAAISVPLTPSPLAVPLYSGITATMFGGAADPNTSAYDGHLIDDSELGVALPYHFPDPRPTVCVWNGGKSVVCKIVDVGPWNTNDPYWQTGARPQAESGTNMRGQPTNRAGIDLTPAAARAVGIDGKAIVDWGFSDAPAAASPASTPAGGGAPAPSTLKQLLDLLEKIMPAPTTTQSGASGTAAAPADLATLLQQILALAQAPPQNQPTGNTPAPAQDQAQQLLGILTAVVNALASNGAGSQLGPVNGALGQTIGNLLNGRKSAIGIIGAVLTAILQSVSQNPQSFLAPLAAAVPGLGGIILPIFLGLTAWGTLGKLEKWAQPQPPARSS
ncbi:MAG: hypothetical protein P4M07_08880 [Xanthobacteraceae bacterium]|nr:hypothetical protein [Xanthobacteraceae bacterium]